MKPQLVIGLGNPLMGDDGVGCHVAERLADDPRLPAGTEVICAGADLLRCAGLLEGRRRVLIIDAIEDSGEPGNVIQLDEADAGLNVCQEHAHLLSTVEAIRLLKMTSAASFVFLGISITCAALGPGLSPALTARMPAVLENVLRTIDGKEEDRSGEPVGGYPPSRSRR